MNGRRLATVVGASCLTVACAPAGVRSAFTRGGSSSCAEVRAAPAFPVVELDAELRSRIEAQARMGTVLLHVDGCGVEVIADCRAGGEYAYKNLRLQDQSFELGSWRDLTEHLPLAASRFEGPLKATGHLSFSMKTVGAYVSTSASNPPMEGNCARVTHWVRAMGLGAFELRAETSPSRQGSGLGMSARAAVASSVVDRDGDLAACSGASPSDRAPCSSCDALVALDLVRMQPGPGAVAVATSGPREGCGPGQHWSDLGECVANVASLSSGEVIQIPEGTFIAGYSGPVGTFDVDAKLRRLHVRAFQIDLTEVTVAAYKECVDRGKCTVASTGKHCNYPSKATHPINCVNWQQAHDYCCAVGKRLPTPDEWEYAARGSDGRTYPWGKDDPTPVTSCYDHGRLDVLWAQASSGTCVVGSFPTDKSPFGVLDMGGNVREWTSETGCVHGVSPCEDGATSKGGCWTDFSLVKLWARPSFVHSSFRDTQAPDTGFRCAK